MRHVSARTAALLSRLAACAESSAAARTLQALAHQGRVQAAEGAVCNAFGPLSSTNSSSCGSWGWLRQARGLASAAEPEAAAAAVAPGKAGITISDAAVERLKELGPGVVLRVMVEGGGCSGFQYEFSLDEAAKEDDRVYEREGVRVVCDDLSLEFLRGSTVDYESDLMRSAFVVTSNPNAASSCGCGSSFVAK